jgi:N-acetylglutamate synthase-like GNAT family acetyltransferase
MSETNLSIAWETRAEELRRVAQFLARIISADPTYISHGEVQQALSPDGKSWASDLEARLCRAMEAIDETRGACVARNPDGDIVGAAIVHWALDAEVNYAVLEDVAVAPDERSRGAGASIVEAIEAEARRRGARWLFLESGLHNERAHAFFARNGFQPMSKVFAKPLAG